MDYLTENQFVYIGNDFLKLTHVQTLEVTTTRAISRGKHFAEVGYSGTIDSLYNIGGDAWVPCSSTEFAGWW